MRAFGCHGKHYFPENDFLLTEIFSLTTEMNFCLHFHFKAFPEKERERERARAREEKNIPVSPMIAGRLRAPGGTDHASSSPTPQRSRSTARSHLREIAPSRDRAVDRDLAFARSRQIEIAINGAISRSVDRDLSKARSRRREIAPLIAISDLDR